MVKEPAKSVKKGISSKAGKSTSAVTATPAASVSQQTRPAVEQDTAATTGQLPVIVQPLAPVAEADMTHRQNRRR
jgi:hypothetical protein